MPLPVPKDTELVIGLVGPVGSDLRKVKTDLRKILRSMSYDCIGIKVSEDILTHISAVLGMRIRRDNEFNRVNSFMDVGDEARRSSKSHDILARGIAARIYVLRRAPEYKPKKRTAYVIDSLKHPDEVHTLREIYGKGFYLIGLHADEDQRKKYLRKKMSSKKAGELIKRDYDEELKYGQRTRDTFHLSDYFLYESSGKSSQKKLERFLQLVFGFPFWTPTLDEYAMFLAFASALRSADLSRQVGAVIVSPDDEIIATGANEVPKYGGGLCWPEHDSQRDWVWGSDSNEDEKRAKVDEILDALGEKVKTPPKGMLKTLREVLLSSSLMDITEYGRAVHAEMEALTSCARRGENARNSTLYCTTFPCHNCAKHIIATGIKRVVYIEPYPKSKARELYPDCVKIGLPCNGEDKITFEPFFGVGPRRFFDLFSMNLGDGIKLKRKEKGETVRWKGKSAQLRVPLSPKSYLEQEKTAVAEYLELINNI